MRYVGERWVRTLAKENGYRDALDGLPADWLTYSILDEHERSPYLLALVEQAYQEGYVEGSGQGVEL